MLNPQPVFLEEWCGGLRGYMRLLSQCLHKVWSSLLCKNQLLWLLIIWSSLAEKMHQRGVIMVGQAQHSDLLALTVMGST